MGTVSSYEVPECTPDPENDVVCVGGVQPGKGPGDGIMVCFSLVILFALLHGFREYWLKPIFEALGWEWGGPALKPTTEMVEARKAEILAERAEKGEGDGEESFQAVGKRTFLERVFGMDNVNAQTLDDQVAGEFWEQERPYDPSPEFRAGFIKTFSCCMITEPSDSGAYKFFYFLSGVDYLRIFMIFFAFFSIYIFLNALDMLGIGFKLLGGKDSARMFDVSKNPISHLMIGILATVLVQSSSTTTSIIISLVGAGELSVSYAIYMVMGANIGTSVTNTLVSMAHVNDSDELRRGFAAATVHDIFNLLSVVVLLPLEWISSAGDGVIVQQGKPGGVLQAMTYEMTVNEEPCDPDAEECKKWAGPIKLYVTPYTNEVVAYDKNVASYVSQKYCDGFCNMKSDEMKAEFEDLMCPGATDHCRAAIKQSTGFSNEDLDPWFESDGKLKSKRYPKYVYIKPDGTRVYVTDNKRGAVFSDEVTLFDSSAVLDANFTAGYNTAGRAYGFCSEGWKGAPCDAVLLKTSCKASRDWEMTDEEAGTFAVIFSIVEICTVLYVLVNTLSYLLKGKLAYAVKYALSVNGYLSIAIGCGITILVQSSSITTSTLTPLCAVGLITLAQMYPLTLGANIGTTVTGLLAATVATSNARESLQVALVHLFFNIFGIVLFYVPPPTRDMPINAALWLGEKAGEYPWFPVAYTGVVFFAIPGIVYGISVAAEA